MSFCTALTRQHNTQLDDSSSRATSANDLPTAPGTIIALCALCEGVCLLFLSVTYVDILSTGHQTCVLAHSGTLEHRFCKATVFPHPILLHHQPENCTFCVLCAAVSPSSVSSNAKGEPRERERELPKEGGGGEARNDVEISVVMALVGGGQMVKALVYTLAKAFASHS